jgi:hypothetical protein
MSYTKTMKNIILPLLCALFLQSCSDVIPPLPTREEEFVKALLGSWNTRDYTVEDPKNMSKELEEQFFCLSQFFISSHINIDINSSFEGMIFFPNQTGFLQSYMHIKTYFQWDFDVKSSAIYIKFYTDDVQQKNDTLIVKDARILKPQGKRIPKCVQRFSPVSGFSFHLIYDENGELQYLETEEEVYLKFYKTN